MTFDPKFQNLVEVYEHATNSFADLPLFGVKKGGEWVWMTYGEFRQKTDALRAALSELGVQKGDRIAVISNNRPEWAIGAYVSFYTTEFLRFRIGYEHRERPSTNGGDGDLDTFFFQLTFVFGSHPVEPFWFNR